MSNTIITIDIATTLKAALSTAIASPVEAYDKSHDVTLYVDGALDTVGAAEDEIKLPMVSAVVNECLPNQYRSVLRTYPVVIEAATWYPDDPAQIVLYTIAQAVSLWLALPSLSLTLAHFDALTINGDPERGVDVPRIQYFRWNCSVLTRKAA